MNLDQPTNKTEQEIAMEMLRSDGLNLASIHLSGTSENLNDMKDRVKPGTWNENQGVIVFAIGEQV